LVAELRRRREEASESQAEATRLRLNGDFAHRIRKAVDPVLRDVIGIRAELEARGVTVDGDLARCLNDIEEGCTELARAPSELRRAQEVKNVDIQKLLSALRNRLCLEYPDIDMQLVCASPRDVRIFGAQGDVAALFENLLYNAIEATGGTGLIKVNTDLINSAIHVTVSDDGPGIPAESVEEIFKLGHSSKGHGRGLGLARARQIVSDLKGTVRVDTRQLKGATFVVALPISKEA
jgi:signal transduction histidine kinase